MAITKGQFFATRGDEPAAADSMTAAQMLAALRLARDVERAQAAEPVSGASLRPAVDENVTALTTARSGKKEQA